MAKMITLRHGHLKRVLAGKYTTGHVYFTIFSLEHRASE